MSHSILIGDRQMLLDLKDWWSRSSRRRNESHIWRQGINFKGRMLCTELNYTTIEDLQRSAESW